MVAGDRFSGRRRERVRLPTGSPVSTYCSTISRSTAAERASRPGGRGVVRRPGGGTWLFMTGTPTLGRTKHGPGGQTGSGGWSHRPHRPGIAGHDGVGGQQRDCLEHGLSDQNAVERVPVDWRQEAYSKGVIAVDRQFAVAILEQP